MIGFNDAAYAAIDLKSASSDLSQRFTVLRQREQLIGDADP